MSININASVIINNLMTDNNYRFSSTKRTIKYNEDADAARNCATDFKKALRSLKQIDTSLGPVNATKNKIKDLVSSYNDFMTSASSINDSKKMDKYLKKLDSLFDNYSSELKSIGVTRASNKKLKFDETNFSEVTTKQLDAVFGKDKSFINDAVKYTKSIYRTAGDSLNVPVNALTSTTISLSASNSALAQSSGTLASHMQKFFSLDYTESNRESIVSYLKEYVENYNNTIAKSASATLNSTESSYINILKKASADNSSDLSTIGINVSDTGTLTFDEAAASAAEPAFVQALFGNSSASYGSLVKNCSENLFASLVNADSSGLSINYYA